MKALSGKKYFPVSIMLAVLALVVLQSCKPLYLWFKVDKIDPDTFAISEPNGVMKNNSYLIIGSERAIMFDSGPGFFDIKQVVNTLTTKPVTAACSHFHYDHIRMMNTFDQVALVDLPKVREHTDGNIFKPDFKMYIFEPLPEIKVDEWWNPSDVIDLGNRKLEVVHLPGHTDTHIALIDRERRLVFSGDLIYTKPAALDPIFDGENLADYYESVKKLLSMTDDSYTFLCGHTTVRLGYSDLAALGDTFYSIFEEGNQGTESLMLFRVFNVVEGKIDLMVRAEDLPSQEPSELIN